jgi:hypothetical protein
MAAEKPVQTPQDVEAMQRLSAAGWGRRWIARELGCSPEMLRKYLRQGGWEPYGKRCRTSVLDGQSEMLRQRFLAHRGNVDVVWQELAIEKRIKVSLRTVQRADEPWPTGAPGLWNWSISLQPARASVKSPATAMASCRHRLHHQSAHHPRSAAETGSGALEH